MSITTRFSVGIHILAVLDIYQDEVTSSSFIASSVNTNPAVIRKIMSLLKAAGLIHTQAGVAGARLTKLPEQIPLLAVYDAVYADNKSQALFDVHQDTSERCLVGIHIQSAINPILHRVEDALREELKGSTLADVIEQIRSQE
ncbi:Rrf2 family transcriptional regulator [Psychrobacter sp. AOP7-A1-24]|uniref:Rrf2 family transcriptional regulator n=1 Tax=Psychrobacter sp. AOP7-A1-24 TaxID=3457646 RepID=UPI00402BB9DC